jgi:hypothetical protein
MMTKVSNFGLADEVFWIKPKVAFFHEPGEPPVGIAIHVFGSEK